MCTLYTEYVYHSFYIIKYMVTYRPIGSGATLFSCVVLQYCMCTGDDNKTFTHLLTYIEGVDRGGGGTGIEGAEWGVEGAESGVEGAGSGSRGGGKRGHCGRGSGKIGGRN